MTSNDYVLRVASEQAGREVKLYSYRFLNKRLALSAQILRSPDSDPLRQVTYVPQLADGYPIGKRRVGAPRQQWRHFTHRYAWKNCSDGQIDYDNTEQQNRQLYQMAPARDF